MHKTKKKKRDRKCYHRHDPVGLNVLIVGGAVVQVIMKKQKTLLTKLTHVKGSKLKKIKKKFWNNNKSNLYD